MATFEDVIIRVTERGAKEAGTAIGLIGKESDRAAGAVAALNRVMYTLGAAFSVRSLVEYIDKWQGMSNQIRIVTKDSAELTKQQERLFKVAQNARVSIASLTDLYASLSLSQKETGVSGEKLHKVIETISKTLTLSGASGQASAAGLRQLVQGLQSGRLNGEELRSVLENTRYTALTLAKGLGVPVGALRQLGADGALTAEKVVAAFLKMSNSVDADFGKTTVTISQALTVLDNAFTRFIGLGGEASGISSLLAQGLILLANNIHVVIGALALFTAGWIAYRIAVTAVTVAQTLANAAIAASPMGRLAVVLGTVIGLMATYLLTSEKTTDTTKKLGKESDGTFKSIGDGISSVVKWFSDVNKSGEDAIASIKDKWLAGWAAIDEYIESWDSWFRSKASSWPSVVTGALANILTAFSNTWNSIKTVVGGIIDWMSTKLKAFLDWFRGALDALIAAAKAFSSSPGQTSADPPKVAGARASGGPVIGGKTYLVGEEGPELWTASKSGTIIPNGGTGGSAMGTQNTSPQRIVELLAEGVAAATNDNLTRIADSSEKMLKLLETSASSIASSSSASSLADAVLKGGNGLSALNNFGDNASPATATTNSTSLDSAASATKQAVTPGGKYGDTGGDINSYTPAIQARWVKDYKAAWNSGNSWGDSDAKAKKYLNTNVPSSVQSDIISRAQNTPPPLKSYMTSAQVTGFREGGSFTVPGGTGVDSKIVPIKASPGERVTVETHKQQAENDRGSSGGRPLTVQFFVTTPDADSFRKSEKQISRDLIMTLQKAI